MDLVLIHTDFLLDGGRVLFFAYKYLTTLL